MLCVCVCVQTIRVSLSLPYMCTGRLNVTGVSEPIIYHGFTLTSKLPFREVIQTIKVSPYSNYMISII